MHNACQKLCHGQLSELQIRVGTVDNLKVIYLISRRKHVVAILRGF